jgi:hypothetical protein
MVLAFLIQFLQLKSTTLVSTWAYNSHYKNPFAFYSILRPSDMQLGCLLLSYERKNLSGVSLFHDSILFLLGPDSDPVTQ